MQAPADGMEAQVAALLAAAGADNGAAVEEAEEALALQVRCLSHRATVTQFP